MLPDMPEEHAPLPESHRPRYGIAGLNGETIPVPLPEQVWGPTVYHYTNATGLLGILDSQSLWASSPLALNDVSEMDTGVAIVQEVWDSWEKNSLAKWKRDLISDALRPSIFEKVKDHVYFFSASRQHDLLNQWQGYARRQGYCLGISTQQKLAVFQEDTEDYVVPTGHVIVTASGWYDVIYTPEKQWEAVTRLLDFLITNLTDDPQDDRDIRSFRFRIQGYMGTLVALLKDEAFQLEEEVRFVASTPSEAPEFFREGPFGLTPYQKIVPVKEYTDSYVRGATDRLAVTRLVCGPVNESEKESVLAAAGRLLRARRYPDVPVDPSRVPYRFA